MIHRRRTTGASEDLPRLPSSAAPAAGEFFFEGRDEPPAAPDRDAGDENDQRGEVEGYDGGSVLDLFL
jgi:hypothetical protein